MHCLWDEYLKGDEHALSRALQLIYRKKGVSVAVLFYASWCPFSKAFRPSFDVLASLYPTVHHFAVEESLIRRRFALESICRLRFVWMWNPRR